MLFQSCTIYFKIMETQNLYFFLFLFLVYLFIYSFIYLFICLFIYLFFAVPDSAGIFPKIIYTWKNTYHILYYIKAVAQTCSAKKDVLRRRATLLKQTLRQRCFPVNFAKFLRITFLTEYLRWLLLILVYRVNTVLCWPDEIPCFKYLFD